MPTPAIHCQYTRLALTDTLKPHPRNPNTHPPEQLRLYRKIIAHAGWRRPITISRQSGRIIRGHGAWQVATEAGWRKVPIEVQDYADEAAELADVLADNQLARYAAANREALDELIATLKKQKVDLELAGLLDFGADPGDAASAGDVIPEPPPQILIVCQNEKHQLHLLRKLSAQGLQVRAQIS